MTKEEKRGYMAAWYLRNKERRKGLYQKITTNDPSRKLQMSEYGKRWRAANRDKTKRYWEARKPKWYQARKNYKFDRDLALIRYARKRAARAKAPLGDRKEIELWVRYWRNRAEVSCHWCRGKFPPSKCHSDHIIPISRGGAHARSNLCIACAPCNLKKHAKMPAQWASERNEVFVYP